ncbi:MAG: nucleotide pyrophosphohydrolase [Bdellovibrionales bacterium]|nr:nucleotide pyrophosphohydrolase [Bdellovibrionales bacterium]
MNILEIKQKLIEFAKERDWEKFHTPKNLAMALNVEAGELLEIFQWMTSEESELLNKSDYDMEKIEDEVADIFLYLVRICTVLNIDLLKSSLSKIKKNSVKYPPGLVRGSSKKYTDY